MAPGRDTGLGLEVPEWGLLGPGKPDQGLLDPVMDQHQATDLDPDTGNRATEYSSRYTWTGRTHFQCAPSVCSSHFA